jgi:hypothetical protein
MMSELRLADQLVEHDRDATLAAYAGLQHGWAEKCGCAGCRNFIATREQAFPGAFRNFLSELGIDLNKDGEAIHYGPVDNGLHFYGGWFYFVGKLIEAGERLATIPLAGSTAVIQPLPGLLEGFRYWFSTSFARPPAIFGSAVGAVEFATLLPWVLDVDPMSDFRPAAKPQG